jgi:hypothetical protein
MTVHDLERLRRAPFRLILPSCESGRLAPAGADELLGLASALLPLGTAGIVASVAQVGDRAAAPLMLALHRRLRSAGPGAGARGAARCPRRRLPRHRRRPGGDRGRLVLYRPGRVITPSQGRSMPGDGAPSAEVVSSTSPTSGDRPAG